MTLPLLSALTPDEWRTFPNWPTRTPAVYGTTMHGYPLYFPTRHGIAAVNLLGQPFGFTHADVEVLHHLAQTYPFPEGRQRITALASRIAALLPPEHTP